MKEHPMLFSTPMVQAIQEDKKTITRRTRGLKLINENPDDWTSIFLDKNGKWQAECEAYDGYHLQPVNFPYGQVGDIIWVRETWYWDGETKYTDIWPNGTFWYKASAPEEFSPRWKPSIHMPKEACRLRLKIADIKVERLQDISEEDAIAEGVLSEKYSDGRYAWQNYFDLPGGCYLPSAKDSFQSLWEKINGEASWKSNPWVWAISFSKI